jgi:hypothetical protein
MRAITTNAQGREVLVGLTLDETVFYMDFARRFLTDRDRNPENGDKYLELHEKHECARFEVLGTEIYVRNGNPPRPLKGAIRQKEKLPGRAIRACVWCDNRLDVVSADDLGKTRACRLRQPHSRIMFFDSAAKHARIRVGDIHDFRSQTVASNLPNLNNAGEPRVLGNVKINPHSIAYIHGHTRQQV